MYRISTLSDARRSDTTASRAARTVGRFGGLAAAAALAAMSLSACGGGSKTAAPPPVTPVAAQASAPAPAGGDGCPTNAASSVSVPVSDAGAVRDELLAAECQADYANAISANSAVRDAWDKTAPKLEVGLFSDDAATPTSASRSDFLLDGSGSYDEIHAFAVTDGRTCLGGVSVIPEENGEASYSGKPTTFAAVAIPAGQDCSAASAANVYRPGSVRD
jgi:hypothetical protein